MKTRILASLIITGVLASSAAQAGSAITVEDINASYLNPSFTRNADVSSYTAPTQPQQTAQKPATCNARVVQNNSNPLNVSSHEDNFIANNYLVRFAC